MVPVGRLGEPRRGHREIPCSCGSPGPPPAVLDAIRGCTAAAVFAMALLLAPAPAASAGQPADQITEDEQFHRDATRALAHGDREAAEELAAGRDPSRSGCRGAPRPAADRRRGLWRGRDAARPRRPRQPRRRGRSRARTAARDARPRQRGGAVPRGGRRQRPELVRRAVAVLRRAGLAHRRRLPAGQHVPARGGAGAARRSGGPHRVGRAVPREVQQSRRVAVVSGCVEAGRGMGAGPGRHGAGAGEREPAGRPRGGGARPRHRRIQHRGASVRCGARARRPEPRRRARVDRAGARGQPAQPGGALAACLHRLPGGPH